MKIAEINGFGNKEVDVKVLLKKSLVGWFIVATIGQWLFAFYVAFSYSLKYTKSGLSGLGIKNMDGGYVSGDTIGNIFFILHLVLAVIIIIGGPLQFFPKLRSRLPSFHRWTGRLYIPSVMAAALSGFYLTWARNGVGDTIQHLGISLDAILIIIFSVFAFKYARDRKFKEHRRFATRLFLVVNGVWFFRIGLMLWVYLTDGIGINWKTFSGPFLSIWAFADYLLPLLVYELYLFALKKSNITFGYCVAFLVFILTIATALGTYRAFLELWLPRMI